MAYRRPWKPYSNQNQQSRSDPTPVDIYWSQKASAYALKFQNTYHWNEMQPFMSYLKAQPYGEWEYDPQDKTWFFIEKHLPKIQEMFDVLKPVNAFNVTFTQKPEGQTNAAVLVPIEVYLEKFKNISGQDIKNLDHIQAKKIYRKACLQNHPDHGGDSAIMASLNEAWVQIESKHYNIKKEIEYASS